MVKRARLIYNPTSGREEMRRRLPDVLERLESFGLETSVHATTGPGDAARAADAAVERGFDLIIAAGGDGTLNEVINGMAPAVVRPPLGILPMGTSNDLSRALGIPRNWDYACDIIGAGYTRGLDIGKMQLDGGNIRYFMNNVAGGVITELSYEVPSKLKTVLGQLAYYIKGLEKLPKLRPMHIQLSMDGQHYDKKVMLFLVANSGCVAGLEQLLPDALYDDGMMDVLVVEEMSLPEFIFLASASVRGEHVNMPGVKFFRTRHLTARSDEVVQLNVDGELGGNAPFHVETLHNHLNVFVDEQGGAAFKEGKLIWNWPFLRGQDGVSDE